MTTRIYKRTIGKLDTRIRFKVRCQTCRDNGHVGIGQIDHNARRARVERIVVCPRNCAAAKAWRESPEGLFYTRPFAIAKTKSPR